MPPLSKSEAADLRSEPHTIALPTITLPSLRLLGRLPPPWNVTSTHRLFFAAYKPPTRSPVMVQPPSSKESKDKPSPQQGIVRDGRGQEQPADKERAQQVSRKNRGNDPPGQK